MTSPTEPVDYTEYRLPVNPTLLQLLTWQLVHDTMSVDQARALVLSRAKAEKALAAKAGAQ